jgi:hypothetical protein
VTIEAGQLTENPLAHLMQLGHVSLQHQLIPLRHQDQADLQLLVKAERRNPLLIQSQGWQTIFGGKFSEQSIDDDSYMHDFLQQRGRDVSLPPPCGLSLKGGTFKKNGRKKQKGAPVGNADQLRIH